MLVETVRKIIAEIERKEGPFEVKCLASRDDDNVLWYLILYSDWLLKKYKNQHDRYGLILNKMLNMKNLDFLAKFGGIYIYPYNNQTIQYLINNKNDMLKHPVGTLIHTTLPDFPWIIQLQSAVKKKKKRKK